MINGHGDDSHQFDQKIVSNFSSNVYNKLDMSGLEKYLCQHISAIHSYPEPDAISLRRQIAEQQEISVEEICVTNGAIESIYMIAQAFRGSKTSVVIPTFSEYEDASQINHHQLNFIESLGDINSDTDLVWLCNPNNPTGRIYSKEYLLGIVAKYPKTYFVVDQSYAAFTDEKVISIEESARYSNIILLNSLTKCFAIPGLRLGYFTTAIEMMRKIKKYSMPWSVNSLALLAGEYLLSNSVADFSGLRKESQRVQKCLADINGVNIYPSEMHFFLCKLEKGKAKDLKEYLVNMYGILIRDASNFRGLNDSYFRIAVQSERENDLLIKALREYLLH